MSAPALRWARVTGATTTELRAFSAVVGVTYTIARYDGNTRANGQWRLTWSADEETLHWCRTQREARRIAQAFEEQRVAGADAASRS